MQELDSVNKGKYLVLERDLTRIRTGGALGIKGLLPTSWVEGVSSGVYVTEGQDSQGIFYRSVNCCIDLENKRLKQAKLPLRPLLAKAQIFTL